MITDHQLHEEGTALLSRYRAVLTGTHPEYDTTPMLDALELRRAEDGTRTWESQPGEYHHAWTGELGGLWRRIGRAPNRLVGIGFCAQGFLDGRTYRMLSAAWDPRAAWIFEGIAGPEFGAFGPLGGAVFEEIDHAEPRLGTSLHALRLATATGFGANMSKTKEEHLYMVPHDPEDPDVRADMVFFETPNGGAVFSMGSIAWAGALAHTDYRNDVARISGNVLRKFLDSTPLPTPDAGWAAAS